MKQTKNAYIDWRFDQPNDVNLLGKTVTSFANTKYIVNQIRADGFNGIVLNTNVPIDPETGKLTLYDNTPGAYNPNKNLPKDTWAVVNYAKKMGLNVTLNFNIVDYHTDNGITSGSIGDNFSKDTFFKEVGEYEAKIATLAKKNRVDVIGIGSYQNGLDTDEYRSQWQNIIDAIHKNYKGKLTYSTHPDSNNTVWSMVDIVSVGGGTNAGDVLGRVGSLGDIYHKPVLLDNIQVPATDVNVWNMLMGGQDLTGITPNYDQQASTIKDILKAAIVDHKADLSGLSFFEFAPWQQANWIQQPENDASKQWNAMTHLHSEFMNNKTAENAFKNWFNYSTTDIKGSTKNDTLRVYAGDKTVDGGKGKDTVVVLNNAKDCQLSYDSVGSFTLVNNTEGTNKLLNCEYVQFIDTKVSLLGHQDYSQYGWTSW